MKQKIFSEKYVVTPDLFDEPEEQLYPLMEDSYLRYKRSFVHGSMLLLLLVVSLLLLLLLLLLLVMLLCYLSGDKKVVDLTLL